jgi:hypothetical protein
MIVRVDYSGTALLRKFDNLGNALQYAYPDIEWDLEKFMFRGKKAEQRRLKVKIEELVPGIEIMEDYKHPDLVWSMLLLIISSFSFFFFVLLLTSS